MYIFIIRIEGNKRKYYRLDIALYKILKGCFYDIELVKNFIKSVSIKTLNGLRFNANIKIFECFGIEYYIIFCLLATYLFFKKTIL